MSKKVITKAIVVNHLNESIGLSKKECQFFFEALLDIIFSEEQILWIFIFRCCKFFLKQLKRKAGKKFTYSRSDRFILCFYHN